MTETTVYRDAVIGEPDTYATGMIDGLPPADDFYRVKIIPDVGGMGTKWFNISPAELSEIRAILARRTL